MRTVRASVELLENFDGDAVLKKIETCGRTCYKSEGREDSAEKFVAGLVKRGHESVLEHFSFSVRFIVDRGVSHEIVRHRIASYSQESTRYCNYARDRFSSEVTFVEPLFLDGSTGRKIWEDACIEAEKAYFAMLNFGFMPEEARSVLPNSLKTELVMTANLREWRHFLKLRTSKAAHPQIREVANQLLDLLKFKLPVVFMDIE